MPLLVASAKARTLKRVVDVVAAAALLVAGTPLCLLVAVAIKLEDGGPMLFRQIRVGRRGKLFTLYKLHSMYPNAERYSIWLDLRIMARTARIILLGWGRRST